MVGLHSLVMATVLAAGAVPGADKLFGLTRPRIVWVGEIHGSVEQPRIFADLVVAAAATGRPVVVALERGQHEQSAWDTFLASSGDAAARQAFLSAGVWIVPAAQDGRSSRPMLDLAETLRSLHQQGRVNDLRLIIPNDYASAADAYEGRMAAAVEEVARTHPTAIVLVYSGTAHASHGQFTSNGVRYTLAAGHLPAGAVTSVFIEGAAGAAWNCQNGDCGTHPTDGYPAHPRGIAFSSEKPGYDAIAWTGLPTTPSPPAAGPPTPEAASR